MRNNSFCLLLGRKALSDEREWMIVCLVCFLIYYSVII